MFSRFFFGVFKKITHSENQVEGKNRDEYRINIIHH